MGEGVGKKDGAALGAKDLVGDADGILLRAALGIFDGDVDSDVVGSEVDGDADGILLRAALGMFDGDIDGDVVGAKVVGNSDGIWLGAALGILDADTVGIIVGAELDVGLAVKQDRLSTPLSV
jgi:hypothetical protein